MESENRYDIVVYGASGYTGQFVVELVIKEIQKDKNITWAVAGRSQAKLQQVVKQAGEYMGYEVKDVPMIIADSSDEASLSAMAKRAKVVVNCVGPYWLYGPKVVKSCLENGAHHVDMSGEPQFLETMELECHELAKEKGIYIIGACGVDSIPSEMGHVFLKNNFAGELNSAVSYLIFDADGQEATETNYGTYESVVRGVGAIFEARRINKKLFAGRKLPKPEFPMPKRFPLHHSNIVNGWSLPFMGADPSCLERSQRYFHEYENERPLQHSAYVYFKSFWATIGMLMVASVIGTLGLTACGRWLLLKYPGFFTFGRVKRKELNQGRENNEKTFFVLTIKGTGWAEKAEIQTKPPDKTMTVQVKGRNIVYGSTPKCVVQSAMTILRESHKMPAKGGVYAPAAAFAKTTLIDRLHAEGVTFEVIHE